MLQNHLLHPMPSLLLLCIEQKKNTGLHKSPHSCHHGDTELRGYTTRWVMTKKNIYTAKSSAALEKTAIICLYVWRTSCFIPANISIVTQSPPWNPTARSWNIQILHNMNFMIKSCSKQGSHRICIAKGKVFWRRFQENVYSKLRTKFLESVLLYKIKWSTKKVF